MAYVIFMILIDSNIWCYYFDDSSKEHASVSKAVESIVSQEEILINTVVIMEVSHFLIKNLGPRIGKEKLNTFLNFPMTIIDADLSLIKKSIDMLCDYSHEGIGGRDATLLATLKQENTNKIMTHDKSFHNVDWIKVIDPV